MPIEVAPMLVIGSCYLNKERIPSRESEQYSFSVADWSDCYHDQYGGSWFFLTDFEGRKIRVRQFELARAMFLQNAHLARTAFRSNGLSGLANIESGGDRTLIRFNRLSDYPASNLRSRSSRFHLAWMFLDQQARKSFGSIFENWVKRDGSAWSFEFKPPDLQGWTISAFGAFEENYKEHFFEIEEVVSLHNPIFDYSNKIEIYHPRFREPLPLVPPGGKNPVIDPVDSDPDLNLQGLPLLGRRLDSITDQRFSFTFGNELNIALNVDKRRPQVPPTVNQDSDPRKEEAGVGHAEESGTTQELDYGINRTDEGDEQVADLIPAESTARFKLFKQVIEELVEREHYRAGEIRCYELPWPNTKRLTALRTETGKPALFHLATLYYSELPLVVIEVDTESLKKNHALSTLVASFGGDVVKGIRNVMQACSDDGVRWNKRVIKDHCNVFVLCKHPHRITHGNEDAQVRTPDEYHQAWVGILEKRVEQVFIIFKERTDQSSELQ